jgi:hypothetical protein
VLTRIDHVMVCVTDLGQGMETFRRLGFTVVAGGDHPGRGTHNAISLDADDYLEILAIRDRAEYEAAARRASRPGPNLAGFIDAGGGLRYVVLGSDDLASDVAAMRDRGVDVGQPFDGSRKTGEGIELRWRVAVPGARNPLPLLFVQHLTPVEERRRQASAVGDHPNGVERIERVYVAAADVRAEASTYARVLGVPMPAIQRGTVINADMAVFDVGPTGLVVAQPAGPGPAADSLARRGPGPFQVLYRTRSMARAARWMQDHGVPPPVRGVRNTGEQAMLVPPEHAAGVYVGLVGPE